MTQFQETALLGKTYYRPVAIGNVCASHAGAWPGQGDVFPDYSFSVNKVFQEDSEIRHVGTTSFKSWRPNTSAGCASFHGTHLSLGGGGEGRGGEGRGGERRERGVDSYLEISLIKTMDIK
jgi:hypothetical protein